LGDRQQKVEADCELPKIGRHHIGGAGMVPDLLVVVTTMVVVVLILLDRSNF
jgi:hypothetical protein